MPAFSRISRTCIQLACAAAITLPGLARAEGPAISHVTMGYTYYNRPGATPADHDAAVISCSTEALKVRSLTGQVDSGGGLIFDLVSHAADHGAFAASLENCMVVRG